jgi:hypothetical protein
VQAAVNKQATNPAQQVRFGEIIVRISSWLHIGSSLSGSTFRFSSFPFPGAQSLRIIP